MTGFIIVLGLIILGAGGYLLYSTYFKKEDPLLRLEREGNYEDCIVEYEKLLKNNELNADRMWRLVELYEKTGQREKMIEKLEELIDKKLYPKEPSKYEIQKKLALTYFESGDEEKSLSLLVGIVNEDLNDGTPPFIIGTIVMGQEDLERAILFLKEAARRDNTDANIFYYLGVCYSRLQDYPRAKEAFEKVIFLREEQVWDVLLFLGILEYLTKDFKKAFPHLIKFAEHTTMDTKLRVWGLRTLAHLTGFDRKSESALQYFITARDITINNDMEELKDRIAVDLICYYLQQGNLYEAVKLFNIVTPEHPNSELYNQIKNLLSKAQERDQYEKADENKINPDAMEDIEDLINKVHAQAISADIIYEIGKIERNVEIDINRYISKSVIEKIEENTKEVITKKHPNCDKYNAYDRQKFLEFSREILKKLNFEIIEENYQSENLLFTQGDGIDYLANPLADPDIKYLIQIRRWPSDAIGELVLKNLQDTVQMMNLHKGMFITTGELSEEAIKFVEKSNSINVISKHQLEFLLNGIINNGKNKKERQKTPSGV